MTTTSNTGTPRLNEMRILLICFSIPIGAAIPLHAAASCISGTGGAAMFANANRISAIAEQTTGFTWIQIDAPFNSTAKTTEIRTLDFPSAAGSFRGSEARLLLSRSEGLLDIRPDSESILSLPSGIRGVAAVAFAPDGSLFALAFTVTRRNPSHVITAITTSLLEENDVGTGLELLAQADADQAALDPTTMPVCSPRHPLALVVERSESPVAMCDGQIVEVGAQGLEFTVLSPTPMSGAFNYTVLSGVRDADGDATFFGVRIDATSGAQLERITRDVAGWTTDVIVPLDNVTHPSLVDLVATTAQSVVVSSRGDWDRPWLVQAVLEETSTWTVEDVASADEPLLDATHNPPQILTGSMSLVHHHRRTEGWISQQIATIGWGAGPCDDTCGCAGDRASTTSAWLGLALMGYVTIRCRRRVNKRRDR